MYTTSFGQLCYKFTVIQEPDQVHRRMHQAQTIEQNRHCKLQLQPDPQFHCTISGSPFGCLHNLLEGQHTRIKILQV